MIFRVGPLLHNILERMNLRDDTFHQHLSGLAYGNCFGIRSGIETSYQGPFGLERINTIEARRFGGRQIDGYQLRLNLQGTVIRETVEHEEGVLHEIKALIPDVVASQVRGKPLSDLLQVTPLMSEFWRGDETIQKLDRSESGDHAWVVFPVETARRVNV